VTDCNNESEMIRTTLGDKGTTIGATIGRTILGGCETGEAGRGSREEGDTSVHKLVASSHVYVSESGLARTDEMEGITIS